MNIDKILLVIFYIIIILAIPLILDYVLNFTTRKNVITKILKAANIASKNSSKPLIIYNHGSTSYIVNPLNCNITIFNKPLTNIFDILDKNSCVIVLLQYLEYIDNKILPSLIKKINYVSGNDFFSVNISNTSPKILWDYKIKNIMHEPYYLPNDTISWSEPNSIQKTTQMIYSYIFKILPYDSFTTTPINYKFIKKMCGVKMKK